MDSYKELETITWGKFSEGNYTDLHKQRLESELKEIFNQMESDYFLNLLQTQSKFAKNENNLFIVNLLGLTDEFDISLDPLTVLGEFPDIDLDYLPIVQKYLKNEWAPKTFGADKVCSIGNYAIFKIKSSLIDVVRVFSKSRSEILDITTKIGLKDDDGKAITWDSAMRLYPALQKYCEDNPDVAKATKRLLHRNRSRGKHAAGLIISSVPIDEFVPLCTDQEGNPVSAFVEGLSGTDLGPLGLVKFDLLVLSNILIFSKCCHIIKQRYPEIKGISNLPDSQDWSDISYLNDPKALKLADEGRLKCIFQFDGQGIQALVKRAGIASFDDLAAIAAIYRPGCLLVGMDKLYTERKRGREKYTLHPLLSPILSKTYGVMVFQEQILKILNIVGEIPDIHCEIIRKAISKKKVEIFGKYKEMFVKNAQKNLSWTEKQAAELWSQIEAFSEYGFNKSIASGTFILTPSCEGTYENKKIEDFAPGDIVLSIDEAGNTVEAKVIALHDHNILDGYEVTFDDGSQVICTLNHKFLTESGQMPLREILGTNSSILCDLNIKKEMNAEENRCMDRTMWSPNEKSSRDAYASKEMRCMSVSETYNWQLGSTMWENFQNQNIDEQTSAKLSKMSNVSLEGERSKWGEDSSPEQISMWFDFQIISIDGRSSQDMRSLQSNQKTKYICEEFKNKPINRSSEGSIRSSQKNICKTRNSKTTSRKITNLERKQPRQVDGKCKKIISKSQKIQNGRMDAFQTRLGIRLDILRGKSKAGGFYKRQYLDRSRWILSFFRKTTSKDEITETYSKKTSSPIAECSSQGSNAQSRSYKTWDDNIDSSKHGMFRYFNGSFEDGCLGLAAEHAPITDTRNLVHRKIIRVRAVGKRQMYDLEVANPTHNYLLSNGIVTSNSHAVAYTYISSRLLYLKAHYPLEFFAAVLSCEDKDEKMKEYKTEAKQFGIKVERVTLNKSKEVFEIVDDRIYMGFGNVKGIGEETAKKIVENAPYTGLEDFLNRFGTEKKVLKPLIALQAFGEEIGKCWEYYERFKKTKESQVARRKRYWDGAAKNTEALRSCILPEWNITDEQFSLIMDNLGKYQNTKKVPLPTVFEAPLEFLNIVANADRLDIMHEISKKFIKSRDGFITKESEDDMESFEDFDFDEPSEEILPYIDAPIQVAENEFYGFSWEHIIESSPEYEVGRTYADFEADEHAAVRMVQVWIVQKPKKITAKTGTVYYNVTTEDANSKVQDITFWSDDYDRFKEELEYWENDENKGHFLSIRVKKPTNGFYKYSFDAPPKQYRWRDIPKDKKMDARILVLARPEKIVKPKPVKPIKEFGNKLIELDKILEF